MFTLDRRSFVQQLLAAAAALPAARSLRLAAQEPAAGLPLRLEYARPAQRWVEALPVGNGRMGAMIFGGIGADLLQLNDDTLWSGGPLDGSNPKARAVLPQVRQAVAAGRYAEADTLAKGLQGPYTQSYLPMGGLDLVFDHGDIASAYRRSLDLRDAISTTQFRVGNVRFTREVLVSHPAQVIAIRLTADRPGSIRLAARMRSLLRHDVDSDGDVLVLRGRAPAHVDPSYFAQDDPVRYAEDEGMRFEMRLAAVADGGRVRTTHEAISIEDADAATLLLSSGTSFNGYDRSPVQIGRAHV